MERLLKDVYFNVKSPACYAGAHAVLSEAKKRNKNVTMTDVKTFLSGQDAYTLHKPTRKQFSRNKHRAPGMNTHMQADLADLQSLKRFNSGYRYLLVVVDVFSRYVWAEPIKNKTSRAVADAFKKIIQERKPWNLFTDAGREFEGEFKKLLEDNEIRHFHPSDATIKCSIVERMNASIKMRLWRYFTHSGKKRYIDVLPEIINAINNSVNRTIGRTPASITYENQNEIWNEQNPVKKEKAVFKVGDKVRIAINKDIFAKGYTPSYYREVHVVQKVLTHRRPVVYILKGFKGVFYRQELQHVR
jgi:hypothetical protein